VEGFIETISPSHLQQTLGHFEVGRHSVGRFVSEHMMRHRPIRQYLSQTLITRKGLWRDPDVRMRGPGQKVAYQDQEWNPSLPSQSSSLSV
jgi:hypothetical protein